MLEGWRRVGWHDNRIHALTLHLAEEVLLMKLLTLTRFCQMIDIKCMHGFEQNRHSPLSTHEEASTESQFDPVWKLEDCNKAKQALVAVGSSSKHRF